MRLDQYLVQFLKIESRTKAQDLILTDQVRVNQKIQRKPSYQVLESDQVEILSLDLLKYVSRAGLKLEDAFIKIQKSVAQCRVLDIGQSTGGFTDYCLQNQAELVVGCDVGENQLHEKLQNHPQVIALEKTHIKNLGDDPLFKQSFPENGFDWILCDVSFISLTHIIPFLKNWLSEKGYYLLLVKPQFECGEKFLNKNGIVKDEQVYKQIEDKIRNSVEFEIGPVMEYFQCQVQGKDGNKEFFIFGRKK